MSLKIDVLKNLSIFTEKHLCLVLITLQDFSPATLLKRDSNLGAFLWILQNFWGQIFLSNTSGGCISLEKKESSQSNLGIILKTIFLKNPEELISDLGIHLNNTLFYNLLSHLHTTIYMVWHNYNNTNYYRRKLERPQVFYRS